MSQMDIIEAQKALAARLRIWGVDVDVDKKAAGFIDDLVDRGWAMQANREARPRPPRPMEECPMHPGKHRDNCGGCTADHLAGDTTPRPHDTSGTNHEAGIKACRDAIAAGVES